MSEKSVSKKPYYSVVIAPEKPWGFRGHTIMRTLFISLFLMRIEFALPVFFCFSLFQAVKQTTWKGVSLSFYVSIHRSTYQMNQKCKIDTFFDVSNQLFLNWLFSWEFGKEIFSQNGKEEWNKEIHHSKKFSPLKTQVISFLNLNIP